MKKSAESLISTQQLQGMTTNDHNAFTTRVVHVMGWGCYRFNQGYAGMFHFSS